MLQFSRLHQHCRQAAECLVLGNIDGYLAFQWQQTSHIDKLSIRRLPHIHIGAHVPVIIHCAVAFQAVQEGRDLFAANHQVGGLSQIRLHEDEYQILLSLDCGCRRPL